jgi:hypothetical protein
MRHLTDAGAQAIRAIARESGFSISAVQTMLEALELGGGHMAQFSHPEFGGYGQWMAGGMTMVGDMFNDHLKNRVNRLCIVLTPLLADGRLFADIHDTVDPVGSEHDRGDAVPANGHTSMPQTSLRASGGAWWPAELGSPNSTGSQNAMRYAYFARPRRLVLDEGGHLTVYDTLDHEISGFSQQQSADSAVKFSSQHGTVDLAQLPVVSPATGSGQAARG